MKIPEETQTHLQNLFKHSNIVKYACSIVSTSKYHSDWCEESDFPRETHRNGKLGNYTLQ